MKRMRKITSIAGYIWVCMSLAACMDGTLGELPPETQPSLNTPTTPVVMPPVVMPPVVEMTPPVEEPVVTPVDDDKPLEPTEHPLLAGREIDLQQALRTASLKLVGDLPTMDELNAVTDRASYERQIDRYLADPRFATQVQSYFQNIMKMAGTLTLRIGNQNRVQSLATAPTFAAQLVVEGRSMNELFTASTNTCPTLDNATGAFTATPCTNRVGNQDVARPSFGVLSDAGMMAHFFSNMGFRRVRWVQETFACAQFPAEYSPTPVMRGAGAYITPWPFESIAGQGTVTAPRVDFLDTSSVICANCHATMNHLAPLFANYDANGTQAATFQVPLPTDGAPLATISDYLPAGENTAWRFGMPASDMTQLGQAMASDPEVARCFVTRSWNWAMSRGDVVNDLSLVPKEVLTTLVDDYIAGGHKLKPTLRAIFTHDDFVRF